MAEKKITRADGTSTKLSKEERKAKATPKRIIAVIFWVLGIVAEAMAILVLNKTLYLGDQMTWLLVFLGIDLVLVIIGSQFWKSANDIDPASEKNKAKFFLQNQMGLIVAIIAFFPIIILLLKNKDLDAKTRKIVTAVAVVALLICGLFSYDWNPISEEEYQAATTALDGEAVYWTRWGHSYHCNPDCQSLTRSKELIEGTIEQAIEAGRTDPCDFCVPEH